MTSQSALTQKLTPMSRFFSIGEVARNLGVSTRTVQRWIASGELIAHRFGRTVRIAESDLILFLEKHRP